MALYECSYCGYSAKAFTRGDYVCPDCGSGLQEAGVRSRVTDYKQQRTKQPYTYEFTHLYLALIFMGALILLYFPGPLNLIAYACIIAGAIMLMLAWKTLIIALVIGSAGVAITYFMPEYYWYGVMITLVGFLVMLLGGIKPLR